MTLQELKATIESKQIPNQLVILKISDSDFIPNQYLKFIEKNTEYRVDFKQNYQELINNTFDIFDIESTVKTIKILRIETFDCKDENLKRSIDCFIICKKISKEAQKVFEKYIIEIPKLEDWQIKDYAYTIAEGVDEKDLQQLIDFCNGNIYRLDYELQKITIFPKEQRKYMFKNFIDDGVFNDLNNYNIFHYTNCVIKKDKQELFRLYRDIANVDVEPIGFLIILVQNFRNIINVQLTPNATAESLGMKSNQFWAVKYSCGYYTKEQLMHIYSFLTDLDRRIKVGEMPMEHLVDYIIVKVLECV